MFKKKSAEPEKTLADKTLLEAREKLFGIGCKLNEYIEKVFIKEKVLSLYIPETPEYEKAKKDLCYARLNLKNFIEEYDEKATAIERFKKAHADEITLVLVPYDSSHQWIEKTVKRLFKKG